MTHEDPIIDPLLDELLAGQKLPDLTARILEKANQSPSRSSSEHLETTTHQAINGNATHAAESPSRAQQAARRLKRRRIFKSVSSLALSLCLVAMLGGVGYVGWRQLTNPQLAKNTDISSNPAIDPIPNDTQQADDTTVVAEIDTPPDSMPLQPAEVVEVVQQEPTTAPRHVKPRQWGELALTDEAVISQINQRVADVWQQADVQPSPKATDHEFCRRTYLQLLGRIPTVEEVTHFAGLRNRNKRELLVDKLLTSQKYSDEFASYWSARLANVLVGRAGGMQDDSPIDRQALETFLANALRHNESYDQIVMELLTAEGSPKRGSEQFNPAANYLVGMLDNDAKLATAKACSTFLGQQLQCAECHNHPTTDWNQEDYWSLNAFFRQTKLTKDKSGQTLVVDRDFSGPKTDTGEVYYEQPNGLIKVAYPKFVDGTKIPSSGKLNQVERRQELAQLIVNSDQFPKATVNRLWQHFFGVGFTQPVDDMGPHNIPSHPELLDNLATQFAESGFNLKRLMRWITLSQPYDLSSRQIDKNLADNPDTGKALFTRYYTRQMEAEQLYHSLELLAKRDVSSATSMGMASRHSWLGQVTEKMGDDEDSERTALDGGISQSLLLMNGGLMHRATDSQTAVLKSVLQSNMSTVEKVDHLFLASLSRKPTKKELNAIHSILDRHKDKNAAIRDIWWALLNSNEFILDH